ncbi:type VII secretion integral membrane protein EccD [Actinacidiphila alni]|uniref:Type VII secretion integral membrane protein EccD n=1 Tax=Actinacidiphila alni TaxID=380248 RepID=A0A1I2IY45_9ACTN|nr:type VII secretion integral membrane protein EccD [Actinacidiphila alni]SFF47432.1 type VII secretion integral membrane protein EccD [Actinacidiphila alni]
MSEGSVAGLCRLTVRAPKKVVDLAVPADLPLADLLPVIVDHAGGDGADLDEEGAELGGWVLQRIGGEPLDTEATPEILDINDGETLLLRPRADALPAVRYDNLVDAVATTVRELPHAWSPSVSRWTFRVLVAGALLGCLALLAAPGGPALPRAALAAGAALLALAGAGAAARVLDDEPHAVLLGLAAGAFLALCGALAVTGPATSHPHHDMGARLLAGAAAGDVGLVLALTVVAVRAVVFVPAAVAGSAGIVGGLLMVLMDVSFAQACAGTALVALVFGAFVPMLSFSLSGLRLPPLPTNASQLQEGIDPVAEGEVAERSALTDRWMTGFYVALGAVLSVCLAGLARHPEPSRATTVALLALLMALHSRSLGTAWQRLAHVLPPGLGLLLLAVGTGRTHGIDGRLIGAAALLLAAALLAVCCWTVPGRRLLPHWGRAGDLLQSVTALAVFPAALWALGLYHDLRSVAG